MIQFREIAADVRTPGTYVEFAPGGAAPGTGQQPWAALLVGQRLSTGTVPALTPKRITDAASAALWWGPGSMMAAMATAYLAADPARELWGVALDDVGAARATGTVTASGPATSSGAVYLYVAGTRLVVPVASGDGATTIAAAMAAAVTADTALPVTASQTGSAVTLTARHAGTLGNGIDIRTNYQTGEEFPAGVAVSVLAMAGGAVDPDVSTVWGTVVSQKFNVIACPFTDSNNLTSLTLELDARAVPSRNLRGYAIVAERATFAAALTLGDSLNSPYLSLIAADESPSPSWQWSATLAGAVASSASSDPAAPFTWRDLPGLLPPALEKRWGYSETEQLLRDGVSTFAVTPSGTVQVQRLISTYQETDQGTADVAYLDANTALVEDLLAYLLTQTFGGFLGWKLASESKATAAARIMTPSLARGVLGELAQGWEDRGLVENAKALRETAVVGIPSTDPNRLDIQIRPDYVNGLRVVAVQVEFNR